MSIAEAIKAQKITLMAIGASLLMVVLAMFGMIGPIAGAILHNGGSFIVILLASSILWAETWSSRR